ncbi:MAG: helix-turn-helix domain-containing protein [Ruminococcaceae bacterium]|nr:helix-turn-helix domain-containing protein [Oscillospiraceae bacterium]
MKIKKQTWTIPSFEEMNFRISCTESFQKEHLLPDLSPHIHEECEIYVNLSGDISFFCNDHIYPMTRGDVLIARPGEYHHCVYRSNAAHQHYWILFDYEPNRPIWESFFRLPFENVLRPDYEQKEELLQLCEELLGTTLSEGERFSHFWSLMTILKRSHSVEQADHLIPKDFVTVLDYINTHIYEKITVSQIAEKCFISTSTLERYFMKYTHSRPVEYIRHKKMTEAAELLRQGMSVSRTVEQLGYCDESYFIELFKKHFGTTPLQYKKHHQIKN